MVTAPVAAPARPRTFGRFSVTGAMLAGVIGLAAVLRLMTLGSQSYWVDESTTVFELHRSLGWLLHEVRVNETTPPLYFVIAWLWSHVFGTGETGLRLLSALCGVGTVAAVFACGRELISARVGLVAAGLAAINPFLIYYSQEARSYALFLLLSTLALWCWLRVLRGAGRGALIGWAAYGALAVVTHFFAAFLLAPQGVWLLIRRRERDVVIACSVVALVQLAMVPLAIGDTHHPLSWIAQFPFSTRLQQVPVQLGLGQLYQSAIVTSGLAGAALVAVVLAALIRLGGGARDRRAGAEMTALAAAVILVPVLLAILGRDYVIPRNLIAAWVPLALLIAVAGLVPRARFAGGLLLAAVAAGFIWADVETAAKSQYQRPPWRQVAAALGRATVPRAIAATDSNFATQPLSIYLPEASYLPPPPLPVAIQELDLVTSAGESLAARPAAGLRLIAAHRVQGYRVWRFALATPWVLPPAAITARALALLDPQPGAGSVLFQQPGSRHLA